MDFDNINYNYLTGQGIIDPDIELPPLLQAEIDTMEAEERKFAIQLTNDIGTYYSTLLRQVGGDYEQAQERLAEDYATMLGGADKSLPKKIRDAAKMVDSRRGRLMEDYETATSELGEDRDVLIDKINVDNKRIDEDFVRSISRIEEDRGYGERGAARERDALSFDQGGRGVYSGGVVDEEKSRLEDRIGQLMSAIDRRKEDVETSYGRTKENFQTGRESVLRSHGRSQSNLDTSLGRNREDLLRGYGRGSEDISNEFGIGTEERRLGSKTDVGQSTFGEALAGGVEFTKDKFTEEGEDKFKEELKYKS